MKVLFPIPCSGVKEFRTLTKTVESKTMFGGFKPTVYRDLDKFWASIDLYSLLDKGFTSKGVYEAQTQS